MEGVKKYSIGEEAKVSRSFSIVIVTCVKKLQYLILVQGATEVCLEMQLWATLHENSHAALNQKLHCQHKINIILYLIRFKERGIQKPTLLFVS